MSEIREIISAIEDRFNYGDKDWTKFSENLSPTQETLLALLRETDLNDNQIATEVYQSKPRDERYRRDKLIIIEHLSNVLCRTKRNSYSTKLAAKKCRSIASDDHQPQQNSERKPGLL